MTTTKNTLYKKLQKMPLGEYEKYLKEEELGFIKINKHPEDENIIILNYTQFVTFERRWNKQTMSARGLILDISDIANGNIYILAKPFEKFFNMFEYPEYEKDIDFNEKAVVMEKMDGSLGISYFFKDEIRFATRGSFESEQAIKATQIWKEKYEQYEDLEMYVHAPVTYLVEIIYPTNKIVVNYGEEEKLVLLGTIYLFFENNFYDCNYESLEVEARHLHMEVVKTYDLTIDKMLELRELEANNREGWVVRFSNDKRLKIKMAEYIEAHRIMHGISEKAKVRAWSEYKLQEYIASTPEEFRHELEDFGERLDNLVKHMKIMLWLMFSRTKATNNDLKSFAIYVNGNVERDLRGFMFEAYHNGFISDISIREHIYANYRIYLEVA